MKHSAQHLKHGGPPTAANMTMGTRGQFLRASERQAWWEQLAIPPSSKGVGLQCTGRKERVCRMHVRAGGEPEVRAAEAGSEHGVCIQATITSGHPRLKHRTRPGKTRTALPMEVTFQLDVRSGRFPRLCTKRVT